MRRSGATAVARCQCRVARRSHATRRTGTKRYDQRHHVRHRCAAPQLVLSTHDASPLGSRQRGWREPIDAASRPGARTDSTEGGARVRRRGLSADLSKRISPMDKLRLGRHLVRLLAIESGSMPSRLAARSWTAERTGFHGGGSASSQNTLAEPRRLEHAMSARPVRVRLFRARSLWHRPHARRLKGTERTLDGG
jgi:hypothetical protein